jgi:hypothetical protein
MEEKSIYIAADGSVFLDPRRCQAYEALGTLISHLKEKGYCVADLRKELANMFLFIQEAQPGEQKLDRILAILFLAQQISQNAPLVGDLMGETLAKDTSGWKNQYGGIAKEIVDIPGGASEKEVVQVLRKYDSIRIATVLETLENSEIPLRIYKILKKYLYL